MPCIDPIEKARRKVVRRRETWLKTAIPYYCACMTDEAVAATLHVTVEHVRMVKAVDAKRRLRKQEVADAWYSKVKFTDAEVAASGMTGTTKQVLWALWIRKRSGAPADVWARELSAKYWIENRNRFPWRGLAPLMEDVELCPF
jgi:hypothetical protein